MDFIKITDSRDEQIAIGKRLLIEKAGNYSEERVAWMRQSLESLATESLRSFVSLDDLFYISIYDYWVYGNNISEEIYFHFPYKTHAEKMEFMTFRTRLKDMALLNDRQYAHIFNNKYDTYTTFKKYYLRDVVRISSADDYAQFEAFVQKHKVFVVKPTSSHLGIGVKKVQIEAGADIKRLFENLFSEGIRNSKDCFGRDTSFLLEELIVQDERLAQFHPYSVNPIRITTLRLDDDSIKVLYPWFKVGANKAFVTSAAFGTYDAGIDEKTGIVITDGFLENGEYDVLHPMTGKQFKGFQIPEWDSLLSMVKELADIVPVRYIGWDMALTPNGWCIMEGNFTGDFMWQMFNQKGFRKEFQDLTGIKMHNQFWWQ